MDLNITLQPKQQEAIDKSELFPILFMGGAKGGGKSYCIRSREIIRRLTYPNSKGLIVRKTYPELLSNHIRKFFQEHPVVVQWYNKSEKTIYWPNGSTTEFSYLQNTDDVYTYQGREYDDISVDEVTQHDYEVIRILRSSLRTTNPLIKPRMFLTGNPGGPGHDEIKRVFVDRQFQEGERPEDYCFVQAFVNDNKALTEADPEYVQRLEDLPERQRKAYLEGNWEIADDKAFKVFSRLKHVIKPMVPNRSYKTILSMDWGFSDKSKFAAYLTAIIPMTTKTGENFIRTVTYKEWMGNGKTPFEWAEIIYKDCIYLGVTPDKCYPDSAMLDTQQDGAKGIGKFMEDRWRQLHGSPWVTMIRSGKDRSARVTAVHNWLSIAPDKLPYALFTESCPYIIDTLPKLRWDEHKLDDIDTTQDDHGYDGWSYGQIRIKFTSVKAGAVSMVAKPEQLRPSYNAKNQELAINVDAFSNLYK